MLGVFLLLYQAAANLLYTSKTEGTILTLYHNTAGRDIPYPGLEYTVDGVDYSGSLSGSGSFNAGETVTVVFNPSNPKEHYILDDKSNKTIVGIAFMIGGVVFFGVGYIYVTFLKGKV